MIDNVAIVSLPVSDQEAAKTFYLDVLGFELLRDNPMGPDQRWVEVRPRGGQTSFTLVTWFPSMSPGSLAGIVLGTSDVHAAAGKLKANGLAISEVESQPWGQFATFEDPDGNGFVLQEAAPGA